MVSVLLLGAVVGALTSGRITDRYGRRPLLARFVPETRSHHADEAGADLHRRWNVPTA